uniref:Amino acid transporter transmembrane domain-containing protein n=1 Tax=Ciona savignyi TaxID=51511 RepID=H2ZHX0_CIOSA
MLVFAGLPIFFMEVALGQFSSLGPTAVWKFNPIFKGVGICMVVLSAFVGIYYNVIIAYTVFYFFSSLTSNLPWESCNNWWNNQTTCSLSFQQVCNLNFTGVDTTAANSYISSNSKYFVGSGPVYAEVPRHHVTNVTALLGSNATSFGCPTFFAQRGTSASEEYCSNYALRLADDIYPSSNGQVNSHLALSLMVAWIVVFYSLIKGIKSSGKV